MTSDSNTLSLQSHVWVSKRVTRIVVSEVPNETDFSRLRESIESKDQVYSCNLAEQGFVVLLTRTLPTEGDGPSRRPNTVEVHTTGETLRTRRRRSRTGLWNVSTEEENLK